MKHYLSIICQHDRPVRFLLARGLVKSGLCKFLTIKQSGYKLRFHPSNLSEQLWIDPLSRTNALDFFLAYLKKGDRVIDVGANIGDTALTASLCVGSSGRVWTIEPHPRTYEYLQENLFINHVENVEAINSAVGAEHGDAKFSDDRRDDMNRVGTGTLTVPVQLLDELITCRDDIALLKVDVEGYERPVFEGAHRILTQTKCLHFEISKTHFSWFDYKICDLLKLIEPYGFKLFRIVSNGFLERIDVSYDTDAVENLLGMRDPIEFIKRTGWKLT